MRSAESIVFYLRTSAFFVLFLFNWQKSPGQIEQPIRYEVDLESNDDYFTVVSAEKYGIALARKEYQKFQKGDVAWQFVMLDTSLYEKFSKEIYINYSLELRGYDNVNDNLYFLFLREEANSRDHLLIEINAVSGDYQTYQIGKTFNYDMTEFEVINNSAIFGGYVNGRPTVVQYFFKEGRTKVLPGFYFDRSRLLQIYVNNKSGIITALTSYRTYDRKTTIAVRKFNSEGEMIGNYNLEPEEKMNLIDARNVSINDDIDIIAGTYSYRNTKYSRGIFLAYVDERGTQNIQYYNYGDLENFFSYMKAKREKRIKNRIKRKKIKGKRLRFNYRLLVHDIIPYENNYILLGEAYYPQYNSYSYYGYTYSYFPSRFSPWNNAYFEGYKYTHAVVVGFDPKGKLLWDNSFEINDVTSYQLKQFVHTDPRKDSIVLLYNYENVIRSKIIEGDEVVEGKSFSDINLKFEDDEVKNNDSEFGGLDKWYDHVFFAYGVQRIKNLKDVGVKLNRKVFFINKVIYN